jgi:hypothetical protein
MEKRKVAVYLPPDLYKDLRLTAVEEDTSMTAIVVEALTEALTRRAKS